MAGLCNLNGIRVFLWKMVMVLVHYLEKADSSNIKKLSQTRNIIVGQSGKAQTSGVYMTCGKTNEYSLG